MKIMIMAQHYAPEEVSGMATQLAADLASRGHLVSFVTCAPNYPYGRVYSGYRNPLLAKEKHGAVSVFRTWSYISSRHSFWARLINMITFSMTTFYGGLAAGKPDIIFSYTPPLTLGITAWLLSKIWRIPWVMRIEDIFPDAAIAAGVIHGKLLIQLLYALERFLYLRATQISMISEGFRQILLKKGISKDKLSVTTVWIDPNAIEVLPKENDFRKEHDLSGKFILMYTGNMGHTSALEDVVAGAARLSDEPDVRFVLVGEGTKKKMLQARTQELGLKNILFLPNPPREKYSTLLAAADIGLVTLNPKSAFFSLPFKTFNIMASARPVLAVTPENSEIAELITKHNCGVNVPTNDPDSFSQTVKRVMKDTQLTDELGHNGRVITEGQYSRQACIDQIEKLLLDTVKK